MIASAGGITLPNSSHPVAVGKNDDTAEATLELGDPLASTIGMYPVLPV